MQVGLRIDVDTLRGTRRGLPQLLRMLDRHRIRASIFCSVGPDNMGRHLRRLVRPRFLAKMWRTGAARLYGWDILLRGTLWPGPRIGPRCSAEILAAAKAGHEVGLHAWDHHRWQMKLSAMDGAAIARELALGFEELARCLQRAPSCSAAPGWICDQRVLLEKSRLPFVYNSDCRGSFAFVPRTSDGRRGQPQIPTTLPTFDEAVGRRGLRAEEWNAWILSKLDPCALNVLTLHAEVEGIHYAPLFEDFLLRAHARGVAFAALGDLVPEAATLPEGRIAPGTVPGREGWVAVQIPVEVPIPA